MPATLWGAVVLLCATCGLPAASVEGRYVRIELPQRATPAREGRILSVEEIQVVSGGRNVAPSGEASQSSGRSPARVAIDGKTDNFTHSDVGEWNPWLEIDLGRSVRIDKLVVANRLKLPQRLDGFLLAVLDGDRTVVWHKRFRQARRGAMEIVPNRFDGSHVGVKVEPGQKGWYDVSKEGPAGRGRFDTSTLFPVGDLDELAPQQINLDRPVAQVDLGLPPDAGARRRGFERRNSDEGVAALCGRLRRVLMARTPGLEKFEALSEAGQYHGALEAYRAYFFDKLAHPETCGGSPENLLHHHISDRGKAALLMKPLPLALEKNLAGVAVGEIRGEVLLGKTGEPGTVNWAPADLALPDGATYERGPDRNDFWRSPQGKDLQRKIELCRAMDTLPRNGGDYYSAGLFPALLFSYVFTGNRDHLDRWSAYVDDWCMNARRDQDDCPVNIRAATELEPQQMRCTLMLLRIVLDERPDFARDLDPATLARLLMRLTEDFAPYTIRAKRAELANWGIMGICDLLHVCSLLGEFKAMDYVNRETWRLWRSNFIQHRTLDGENCEAWDQGHNGVDIEHLYVSVPFARRPAGVDDLDLAALWDQAGPTERSMLVHLSPSGGYWPRWSPGGGFRALWSAGVDMVHNSLTDKYLVMNAHERYPLDLVADEPGARARIETLLAAGKAEKTPPPPPCSDIAPYAAMYYLRDSWRPGAEYLLMQNFLHRSQDTAIWDVPQKNRLGGSARTMYDLSKNGRVLIAAAPVAVDKKPDNRWHDAVPTGGKTAVCAQAGRHVVDTRFHTSRHFDLAEARQDAPYCRPEVPVRGDWYGLYERSAGMDNTPVRDVTAWRQVFHVRGEGIWIVADRMENASGRSREYSQFFTLPAVLHEKGYAERVESLAKAGHRLIQVDPGHKRLRTANPDFANISVWFFGPQLHFAGRINSKLEHVSIDEPQIEILRAALGRGEPVQRVIQNRTKRPVSIRWEGAGNQTLVTLLCTRPPAREPGQTFEGDLPKIEEMNGPGGVRGFAAETGGGATVHFQAGPQRKNRLQAGPARAEAESLLAVEIDGRRCGIVLGCASPLTLGTRAFKPPAESFEYLLTEDGAFTATPIHRPIDTVRISPAANVFADSVRVAFDVPTQDTSDIEFRYTLDGSDPTQGSRLYTRPFTLDQTTMVKVRPFRKGLDATPWNIPGVDAGKTVSAVFRKQALRPAAQAEGLQPGLRYEYFEGDWPTLFTYAGFDGVLEPESTGTVKGLLDPQEAESLRKTDRAYAIRCRGYVRVPATGVYSFHAPEHLYTTTMDAGYDLRVFVDGEEWYPHPGLHSENIWHIPLEQGLHRVEVAYTDYRWKRFRDEYWMSWREEEMWQGTPRLEVSGPGVKRQPLPAEWLWH